jgi:hypothetical protein
MFCALVVSCDVGDLPMDPKRSHMTLEMEPGTYPGTLPEPNANPEVQPVEGDTGETSLDPSLAHLGMYI